MKHFFYNYNEMKSEHGILNRLFDDYFNESEDMDECLKVLYDAADIIRDIRFEKDDKELAGVLNKINEMLGDEGAIRQGEKKNQADAITEKKQDRIDALKSMWEYAEQSFKKFESEIPYLMCDDNKYRISTSRILYHLSRGNICLRISQCYFENCNLEQSEFWGDRAMEILWHGKQAAIALRDSGICQDLPQIDLYLRLIKLNLAKYYRDYALKNRRSDFDAALDEFKWTRRRVEDKINNKKNNSEMKRQYILIWMDAMLNIAYIHRQKYQAAVAEKEMLYYYRCIKDQLIKKEDSNSPFSKMIRKADQLMSEYKDEECLESLKEDLPNLSEGTFDNCNNLDDYDRRRYFLLILLEFGRIFRALHLVKNYARSAAIAVIADNWSYQMDLRIPSGMDSNDGYKPGNNLDALIIYSNSIRKYIKYSENNADIFAESLSITSCNKPYEFQLRNVNNNRGLGAFVKKLMEFADRGHLYSKEEVIKWHCFYIQNPQNLDILKNTIGVYDNIKKYFSENNKNYQIEFLKGLFFARSGCYRDAIDIFEKLTAPEIKATQYIRCSTIGLKARYLLANCYMALAEYSKAEKLLKNLKNTLSNVKSSRTNSSKSTDAETDARIEIDLGYCYMQKGEYEEGFAIYKNLFGKFEDSDKPEDKSIHMTNSRRIMGLNNYAACCILSIDDKVFMSSSPEQSEKLEEKINIARKIFLRLDSNDANEPEKKNTSKRYDPETSLLKGYYTLCTGHDPEEGPLTFEQLNVYMDSIMEQSIEHLSKLAHIKAHKYFCEACRASEAFSERYELMDEGGLGDRGKYRNEVERISAYLINLVKLNVLYVTNKNIFSDENMLKKRCNLTEIESKYLFRSQRNLEQILLSFPKGYQISLKAAIALAEWLVKQDNNKPEDKSRDAIIKQLYRSFGYITIYEERGAKVFNNLKDNRKFRLFTADQRGKLLALLLCMYRFIKTIKEECCFTIADEENVPSLVHYTSMTTLKNMLSAEQPQFRINNCGYMNDVFEGTVFLKIMSKIAERSNDEIQSDFIKNYFPQLSRSHEDRIPAASNVYIGSLSVKEDSFHMWSVYAAQEKGCNVKFGKDFFDIKGAPYYPRMLRDYLISRYTDEDYPLYIVQYIDKEFVTEKFVEKIEAPGILNPDNLEAFKGKGRRQNCGTEAICYAALLPLLRQIYIKWKALDDYLADSVSNTLLESKEAIYAFTADRINEIRFLFKDVNYEFEGEVRAVYTDPTDGNEAETDASMKVPRVYVNLKRELEDLTVRIGSRIEDATVDKYVTWLKHTKRVKRVGLAKQNRYTE